MYFLRLRHENYTRIICTERWLPNFVIINNSVIINEDETREPCLISVFIYMLKNTLAVLDQFLLVFTSQTKLHFKSTSLIKRIRLFIERRVLSGLKHLGPIAETQFSHCLSQSMVKLVSITSSGSSLSPKFLQSYWAIKD